MTTIVPLVSVIGPGTAANVGGLNDTLFVQDGISLISTDGIGARLFADNNAIVHGVIHGETNGVVLGEEIGGGHIFVSDTGSISASQSDAITAGLLDTPSGQLVSLNDFSVENHGEIVSFMAGGIYLQGAAASGEITTTNDIDIRNFGVISTHAQGDVSIFVGPYFGTTSVYNGDTGIIQANAASSIAISVAGYVNSSAGLPTESLFLLENDGEISGNAAAIVSQSLRDFIVNTGNVTGNVSLGALNDYLVNTGLIIGTVDLGSEDDIFRGFGGEVLGIVSGGSGDDLYMIDQVDAMITDTSGTDTVIARNDILEAGGFGGIEVFTLQGEGDFVVQANDLANVITGNAGNNVLRGGAGNDTINGNGGDDLINAGDDNDVANGQSGNDELNGEAGNDTLRGGTGNDTVTGGEDDDNLFGQDGNDILKGGLGRDILNGGLGADELVWEDVLEMGNTNPTRDIVQGFQQGIDVLDVSGIDPDQTFSFEGAGAFVGGGQMSIRVDPTASGHSIVRVDSDGDGTQDGMFLVRGVTTLTADDFVL